jgi:HTH-type transcriptional regulator / antitoxin HigA
MLQQFSTSKIMESKLIKTEQEYDAALERMELLFDLQPGDDRFDEAELLITLIDLYERQHHAIEAPDPIDAIEFRMEQMGYKRVDMIPFLGTKSRVSEILNRQRKLTVEMMRKLHKEFGIPAESLLA